jgi:GDPmannose 4,6-dehydratase
LRGLEFVTRKITHGAARIRLTDTGPIELGNLHAKRDWGYAKEYVEGMWRMMQAETPDTYVLATNRTETVRDFATMAFRAVGMDVEWVGRNENERGVCPRTGRVLVCINPDFYRAAEVDLLRGDSSRAEQALGWKHETTLEQLCAIMVEADFDRIQRQLMFADSRRKSPRRYSMTSGAPAAAHSAEILSEAVASPVLMSDR